MTPPKLAVDIVCIASDIEAFALRSALEWWQAQVTLHLPGMANDVVRILGGQERLSEYVVLTCHGNERGFILPELVEELESEQPYHGELTPSNLGEFLSLPGKVVVNTGCALGTAEFAKPFLRAGVRAYIGAVDYPDGDSVLFYTLHLFYGLLHHGASLEEAHAKARSHDQDTGLFYLYQQRHQQQPQT
jgi:hypothetical protein